MELYNPSNRHPLLDRVIDATLAMHASTTGFLEHRLLAAPAPADVLATLPAAAAPDRCSASRPPLEIDPYTVTDVIAQAIAVSTGP